MKIRQFMQVGGDEMNIAVGKDHGDPLIMLEFCESHGTQSVVYNPNSQSIAPLQLAVYGDLPIQVCLIPEQAATLLTKLRWATALSPKPKVVKPVKVLKKKTHR